MSGRYAIERAQIRERLPTARAVEAKTAENRAWRSQRNGRVSTTRACTATPKAKLAANRAQAR